MMARRGFMTVCWPRGDPTGRSGRNNRLNTEGKMSDTLYARLGGYDAIAAVSDDLLVRLRADAQLARFWLHRSEDSLLREKQSLINFIVASAGGPLHYSGRDMKVSHRGLRITESDWRS